LCDQFVKLVEQEYVKNIKSIKKNFFTKLINNKIKNSGN
jgi:hypothetical protein